MTVGDSIDRELLMMMLEKTNGHFGQQWTITCSRQTLLLALKAVLRSFMVGARKNCGGVAETVKSMSSVGLPFELNLSMVQKPYLFNSVDAGNHHTNEIATEQGHPLMKARLHCGILVSIDTPKYSCAH